MKVKNGVCIRRLSRKTLLAAKKRNIIAISAIALTTLLFTALFTIVMSLNASYQSCQFRQLGGYSHGSFKEVSEEQIEKIASHPRIKAVGARTNIGICDTAPFTKESAEVSYMDANCTKWSYAIPRVGRMPESGKEISMDRRALQLLGAPEELGTEITLTFRINDKNQIGEEVTDTFTLVGYWDYDSLLLTHYINITKDYVEEIQQRAYASGLDTFRTDLNVMLPGSIDIEGQLEKIQSDLGMEDVRLGISWAYTASSLTSEPGTIVAIAAFLILVIFTGYLVIYNIFQISVAGDIRYYGLLKTIGVTPRQLKRLIRYQALMLCVPGIPLGLFCGYAIGALILPVVLRVSNLGTSITRLSISPVIFIGAALFAVVTVLISCRRPGNLAAKISPVEATKYTDTVTKKSTKRRNKTIIGMAAANLGRNKKKTTIVVVSLSLSLVLLNILFAFVNGFDMDRYLSSVTCCDFIVSTTNYFRSQRVDEYITEDKMEEIKSNTTPLVSGYGYTPIGVNEAWMKESAWRRDAEYYNHEEDIDAWLERMERKDDLIKDTVLIEGLDDDLLDKLQVLEGSVEPLKSQTSQSIAIDVSLDDDDRIVYPEDYPAIGESISIVYADEYGFRDTRTGEVADDSTPNEYCESCIVKSHEVTYTVCAYVAVPYAIGNRYYSFGYSTVLGVDQLRQDSGQDVVPMFYAFDTENETAEAAVEEYLAQLTAGDMNPMMYESKETKRGEFEQLRNMFLLVGGVLCAIIALVGILNFFNAVMTGILARNKEFAVLQAIGMSRKQLKQMLVAEGLFYAAGSAFLAFILSLVMNPLVGKVLEQAFWFYSARFTILPVVAAFPIFAVIGCLGGLGGTVIPGTHECP